MTNELHYLRPHLHCHQTCSAAPPSSADPPRATPEKRHASPRWQSHLVGEGCLGTRWIKKKKVWRQSLGAGGSAGRPSFPEGHGRTWVQQKLLALPPGLQTPPQAEAEAPLRPGRGLGHFNVLHRPPEPTCIPSLCAGRARGSAKGAAKGQELKSGSEEAFPHLLVSGPRGGVYLSPSGVSLGQVTWGTGGAVRTLWRKPHVRNTWEPNKWHLPQDLRRSRLFPRFALEVCLSLNTGWNQ